MKFLAPRTLPTIEQILADLGNPPVSAIARFLDVTEGTVRLWKRQGWAPKPATLALYWETSFGQSNVTTYVQNGQMYQKLLTDSLNNENNTLRLRIARLEKIGRFGSANSPYLQGVSVGQEVIFSA